ncbi:MAG: hypothetical protein OEZ36_04880 [Spirochaetota bacterium]|nr:hypothetical protein [Spirochaetota bacterium]
MKRKYLKTTLLVLSLSLLCYAALFGLGLNHSVKYYQTFRYVSNEQQGKAIIFLNELSKKQKQHKWHVKVFFDGDGNWTKFENYNRDGKLVQAISNTILASVKFKTQGITLK